MFSLSRTIIKWLTYSMTLFSLSSPTFATQTWNGRIIQVSTQKTLSMSDLTTDLSNSSLIILGEKHNTSAIQSAQSLIISNVVKAKHLESHFITAWEFLNYPEQENINLAYARFVSGKIDGLAFLMETQGTIKNNDYIPILEVTKILQGYIIGVNISREAKAPILKNGIKAVDPKYLPPNFAMGSAGYHQRFIDIMHDHVPLDSIENYYAAQCLTDDIMAYTLQKNSDIPLLFLVTGSFHTDYYDGVVNRIKIRLTNKSVSVIRFIDASDYTETELSEILSETLHDKVYGNLADYVYFANEPSSTAKPAPKLP